MQPAAEKLALALAETTLHAPTIPVIHNADVASYTEAAAIRDTWRVNCINRCVGQKPSLT